MRFRPGSLLYAMAHGFGYIRKAKEPTVDECYVVFHKPSRNYSSVNAEAWAAADKTDYELVAVLHKHSGPELTSLSWDIK